MDNTKKRGVNQKTSTKKSNSKYISLFVIFICLSIFTYNAFIFQIPILIGSVFTVLLAFVTYNKNDKGSKFLRRILLVIALILAILSLIVSQFSSSILKNTQLSTAYVITLNDNTANKLSDLEAGSEIFVQAEYSYEGNQLPIKEIEKDGYEFTYTETSSYLESVSKLYNQEAEYIIINSLENTEVLQEYPTLADDVKILAHYEEIETIKSSGINIKKEPFTILVSGSDSRSSNIDENSRSDSIILATINPNTSKMHMTSLPRDAYVTDTCTGQLDKITHSSLEGMECLISTVSDTLAVPIDYYAKINFTSVIDAIDAVGGVDIEVDQAFCGQDEYDNLCAYYFEPGMMHLSGAEALSYGRERKSFADGDYTRAQHQQQVITAFITSMKQNASVSMLNSLLSVASNSVRTNLSEDDLIALYNLTLANEITSTSSVIEGYGDMVDIPYRGLYGTSVQQLDQASLDENIATINSILEDE